MGEPDAKVAVGDAEARARIKRTGGVRVPVGRAVGAPLGTRWSEDEAVSTREEPRSERARHTPGFGHQSAPFCAETGMKTGEDAIPHSAHHVPHYARRGAAVNVESPLSACGVCQVGCRSRGAGARYRP